MIPKTIHYCWFGGKEKPQEIISYISTWKKHCPEYTIKEWNESNFDVNEFTYAKQAYRSGQWAFVSDVARLKALVQEGGFYLDTDVELVASLNQFLDCDALFGFDRDTTITTATMASTQGNPLYRKLLEEYNERSFQMPDGTLNQVTNVMYTTRFLEQNGFSLNNTFQERDGVRVYPKDYFTPVNFDSGISCYSERTVAIHHFSSTWRSEVERKVLDKCRELCIRYGEEKGGRKFRLWKIRFLGFYHLQNDGVKWFIAKLRRKLFQCKT